MQNDEFKLLNKETPFYGTGDGHGYAIEEGLQKTLLTERSEWGDPSRS
jgi:hypothetical protein